MTVISKLSSEIIARVEIPLGFGMVLREEPEGRYSSTIDAWNLYQQGISRRLGYLEVYNHLDIGPTISLIWVAVSKRGEGWGQKMVEALARHYGSLSSDHAANTSKAAIRMWERIGAEKIPANNRRGFFYLLRG